MPVSAWLRPHDSVRVPASLRAACVPPAGAARVRVPASANFEYLDILSI